MAFLDLLRFLFLSPAEDARYTRQRLIADQLAASPRVAIAHSPEGLAVLEGWARPLELIAAPASGRAVIGFRLRLFGSFDAGEDIQDRLLLDVSQVQEFELVERETGHVARIVPEHCLPLLKPEAGQVLELADLVKPLLALIVERALIPTADLVNARALWAVEHVLVPDEPVSAYGSARHEISAEVGYRELPVRVVLSPPEQGLLVVADQHLDALLKMLEVDPEIYPSDWWVPPR